MNTLLVANFLGWLMIGLGVVQLAPLAAALLFGEPTLPYAASALAAAMTRSSPRKAGSRREAARTQ
mgnify:CR=1 FL=1